jgi:hypothetical protein
MKHSETEIKGQSGNLYRADAMILSQEEEDKLTKVDGKTIYHDDYVTSLNPNNIDINKFWKTAVDTFSILPICGVVGVKTIEEANMTNLNIHHRMKTTESINHFINHKVTINGGDSLRMIEIGPGYGNMRNLLDEKIGSFCQYQAIDVNPLFDDARVHKCDGRTFPNGIVEEVDLVYSMNVFQHLTPEQRTSYYNEAYKRLRVGGEFICGQFIVTPENVNIRNEQGQRLFGMWDNHGNTFCNMFKQLTIVSSLENLENELRAIGFDFEVTELIGNSISFKCVKL